MNMFNEKRAYHFNITEVENGKIREVMNFNFGGHHDLNKLAELAQAKEGISEKHARELVVGLRLLHHALKKNPQNEEFAAFLEKLNEFKNYLKKGEKVAECNCAN